MNQIIDLPKRMDPPDCSCTDCLTGYSIPIDVAIAVHFDSIADGNMQDFTGLTDQEWDEYSNANL